MLRETRQQEERQDMKSIVLGILAHVDAGKTTLSEALLYLAGTIRKMGRVDNRDAFLDTYALERARGITIFSKQAALTWEGMPMTLLDTPGHVDFSAEMERTLQVLDYAVLVISGADGVQSHTITLWRLLAKYRIPVFLFVNKMDQPGTDREQRMRELQKRLDDGCVDFAGVGTEEFMEHAAMCDEKLLERYLETGNVEDDEIRRLIKERRLFPCFFGSALKRTGVEELLDGIRRWALMPEYPQEFEAKVYKISRDDQGNRLTHLKVTGGRLKVKGTVSGGNTEKPSEAWQEKVNQIRVYSGERYEAVPEAEAGTICAVSGLTRTYPGQGLGAGEDSMLPVLEPVLSYQVKLPEGCDGAVMLPKFRQLEEEDPLLRVVWNEELKEISMQLMGEVQIEVLKSLIEERFGVRAEFGTGNIVYKETIAGAVEGVGHFEPLRHYAEVHLLMEPGERGSGLQFEARCSEDDLDRNWQRLVLTHLEEKVHRGVLTGAAITDMKITLVAGRAHNKHTEGGDFRQATYRALRQGLMEAACILLEPWYTFRLEVPEASIGRAMTDIEKRCGTCVIEENRQGQAVLTGQAPVASMRGYQSEVMSYTRGQGRLACTLKGYEPCHNSREIIEQTGYDPERDTENPTGSVFCAHGAGFVVSWDRVKEYMHVDSGLVIESPDGEEMDEKGDLAFCRNPGKSSAGQEEHVEAWLGTDEIDAILERTFYSNSRDKSPRKGYPGRSRESRNAVTYSGPVARTYQKQEARQEYLLVDGYNIIFAWEELRELARDNMDGARGRLMDLLCNYQAIRRCCLMVVFDAYRVAGHVTEVSEYHNIQVVYTKEAETADQYIEKFAHENARRFDVSVATSDGVEQVIILGQGCRLISARELKEELDRVNGMLREEYLEQPPLKRNRLYDILPEEVIRQMREAAGEDNQDPPAEAPSSAGKQESR